MSKNIKGIRESLENDKLLAELTEAAEELKGYAQTLETRATARRYDLLDKLHGDRLLNIPTTYDLDEIEGAAENIESRESLARKIVSLERLIRLPWREEPNFKEAAEQYLVYIEPILREIEEVKAENRKKIEELDREYEKKRLECQAEIGASEKLIVELLKVTDDHSKWIDQRSFTSNFNSLARADELALARAGIYRS